MFTIDGKMGYNHSIGNATARMQNHRLGSSSCSLTINAAIYDAGTSTSLSTEAMECGKHSMLVSKAAA
jgi:hypothetical protein